MYKCFENYSIVYTLREKTKLSSFKKRFFIHFIRRWVVWYRCHREIFNCKSVCRHTLHICVADKINEWIIICLLVCFWFACSTFYLKSVTQSTDWLIGRCGQKVMTLKKHWNYIRGSCAAKLNIFTALSIHKFHIRTHVASLDAFFPPLWLPQRSFVIKIWVIRSFISCEVHLSCVTLVWNSCLDCFRFIPVSSWTCPAEAAAAAFALWAQKYMKFLVTLGKIRHGAASLSTASHGSRLGQSEELTSWKMSELTVRRRVFMKTFSKVWTL